MRKKDKIKLISKYLDGSLSPEDDDKLQKMLGEGEVDNNELQDYIDIVRMSQKLEIPEFRQDPASIFQNLSIKYKKTFLPRIRQFSRIAAVLLTGIVAGAVIMYVVFNKDDQFVEVETKKGDKIHVTIPGNNEVWLNSRSSIKYAASFSGSNRIIELKGEAYFKFIQNQNTPVIIRCGETQIVCSQGSLNIEHDINKNKLDIEVEKGWVSISHPLLGYKQYIIEEGFKGTLEEMVPLWIEQNKNPNYLAWHTKILRFNNTPLRDVAETLSEVYDIHVDVKGDVKYCIINEIFNNTSLETILLEIQKTLKTQIKKVNNTVIITGNPC